MKEEVDVQIFHAYHILRKSDRRKITSRHVKSFKFYFEEKKKTQACTQQKQVIFMVKSKGEVRQFPLQLSSL